MTGPLVTGLLVRWLAATALLAGEVGGQGRRAALRAATGQDLLARYAEPQRRYHDVQHLAEVLAALDLLTTNVPPVVACAAWFHDAVYDPAAGDNEQRSAELATAVLPALGVPAPQVAQVARLVLLTAGHRAAPDDAAGALLCDADLAVLGAAPARYRQYAGQVREEYAAVPDEAFRTGRTAVLHDLLARPRLYATPAGGRRWEHSARRNITAELADLAGPAVLTERAGPAGPAAACGAAARPR